ncbi:DNA polymerase III subunit alpha [Nautilia sp. PV-1]|uniref:DNA polymerase III subunit alpha n=1 Tax=Nautilia sp. PV-1 TaxID=2579250 RepID=UPI000FDA92DD|nr:DNA polymerase III subunit alpha [Nautilia sp. PV-1]AZV47031.1 DNA polymerase III subunit alpha [Nautilia sp. PV-1]
MDIKNNYYEFRNALTKGDTQKAQEYFQKAFNEAFDLYQIKLTNNEKFNLLDEDELFAVVVLVDNAIGFWKEGMIEEGTAFCESMIDLIDSPKLKEMFKGYSLGMQSGIDVDTFFRNYVDLSKVDEEFPQFLCNFNDNIKELIK